MAANGRTLFSSVWEGHDFQSCRECASINPGLLEFARNYIARRAPPKSGK